MSWLKTFRQFLTLIMGLFLIIGLIHSCVRYTGKSNQYHRIHHEVLLKINNIIYLNNTEDKVVFDYQEPSSPPEEIKSMSYFKFSSYDQIADLEKVGAQSECLFLDFEVEEVILENIDKVVAALDQKNCLFFNTPYLKMKGYFSLRKPRWFYNVMEVDLQKSRFLTSLGLSNLAPLKGDFWVYDKSKSSVSDALFREIQRRDKIIFIKE